MSATSTAGRGTKLRADRRPGVFGGVQLDNSPRPLRRITRLIGGLFTRHTSPNPSGSLANKLLSLAISTPPNTPDLRPSRRVLEGRERLAGGETTGSSAAMDVSLDRAPAGAREASASPASAMTLGVFGRFSRPFWAQGSPMPLGAANPVVAPPANLSRASGTLTETPPKREALGLRQPCCRFGVGAALLPGVDSRSQMDSMIPRRPTPAGLAPKSGGRLPQSMYAACLVLAMLSISCGKKEAPKSTVEAPKSAAVSDAKIDAAIADALTPSEPSAPTKSDVQAGLEAQAEDILSKYPNKNAQDILNVPEVHEALKAGLTKLSKDKNLQDQINNSVALAAKMKGLSGEPGTVGLDLDLKGYDHSRKSRMVQAVISEDPRQIVRFITEEIGEAAPELSFGGAERASNGVAIRETPPPTPK